MLANRTVVNGQQSPLTGEKRYPTIAELKEKYESYARDTKEILQTTPKFKVTKISKVQQMTSMFNSKTAQSVEHKKLNGKNATGNSSEAKFQNKPALPQNLHINKLIPDQEKQPIPSPRSKSKAKAQQNLKTFCVAEERFAKLTVKDKVQLYNEFINEMSKKNPKFVKHAELMEANNKKAAVKGGVVNEKQASVKQLLADLEANCSFPRQTVSSWILQPKAKTKNDKEKVRLPIKSKEFEDIWEDKVSHISTLSVTLQQSKPVIKRERRAKSLPRYKTENEDDFKATVIVEPRQKRNNAQMRFSLPFEAYAPPKKIRRTRAERLAPKLFFQSKPLQNLFFTWLNEKRQEQNITKGEQTNNVRNSIMDQLLDETIAKMENLEIKQQEIYAPKVNEKEIINLKIKQPRGKKMPAVSPIPKSKSTNSQISASISVKPKHKEDMESGLSALSKVTSDESQADNAAGRKNDKDFELELAKPVRPARKKKLRRTLSWKKAESAELARPITNSTDSDSEIKKPETKTKAKLPFLPPLATTYEKNETGFLSQPSSEELDVNLIREVNSPRKIKSAYTLTAYSSSPSPLPQEEEDKIKYLQRETSLNWSSAIETTTERRQLNSLNKVSSSDITGSATNMFDSFIDLGFETGSNDMESPVRAPKRSTIKIQDTTPYETLYAGKHETANPSNFSTPIKEQQKPKQFITDLSHQQLCSPIIMPLKSRRKSMYDAESRRSSLAMQVIREDHPLEHHEICSPRSINSSEQNFFAHNPTLDAAYDTNSLNLEKTSQFWLKSGDFTLSFDIFYHDADRVSLLFEIFSQKSYDTKDLQFGIDNFKFSFQHAYEQDNISKRFPRKKECSHYWFSTGDLAIPFIGNYLTSDKIQSIFEFLKTCVAESGLIRFGVDAVEFSNACEFWNQSPKYSMDSNYSMLVGLQSGSSNGLEGRSKYAWPNTKTIPVSDLDQSDYEGDNFEETDSSRFSFSSFGSKQFDLTATSPSEFRSNTSIRNSETFGLGYENESLDFIFNETCKDSPQEQQKQPVTTPVPVIFETIKSQRERLSLVKEKLSTYTIPANLSCDALDSLKGTPEYIQQLKTIVSEIVHRGSHDGFKGCSVQELESYMFFLTRYADICLHNCSDHMEKVLDALLDQRSVEV